MEHPNFNELEDLTVEEQIEKFKTNMEVEDNRIKERKEFYSFDDF